MPTISMFFGLIIRMHYSEHNPPHIHVRYQDTNAVINLLDGKIIAGTLSDRHYRFVQTWVDIHKEELLANWQLCQNGEEPFRIDPLK
jgi:hypothetical protein